MKLDRLAVAATVCAVLAPAMPLAAAEMEESAGVRVFKPSPSPAPPPCQCDRQAVRVNVKTIIVNRPVGYDHRRYDRWRQADRALFQRWTGFRKVYSGPRYPF